LVESRGWLVVSKQRIEQELEGINDLLRKDMEPDRHKYLRGVKIGLETSLCIIKDEEPKPSEIPTFVSSFLL